MSKTNEKKLCRKPDCGGHMFANGGVTFGDPSEQAPAKAQTYGASGGYDANGSPIDAPVTYREPPYRGPRLTRDGFCDDLPGGACGIILRSNAPQETNHDERVRVGGVGRSYLRGHLGQSGAAVGVQPPKLAPFSGSDHASGGGDSDTRGCEVSGVVGHSEPEASGGTAAGQRVDMKFQYTGIPQKQEKNLAGEQVLVKYDAGKPDYSLLPLWALVGVVKVMMYGAKKYSRDGWQQGSIDDVKRYEAAALRHRAAAQRGQEFDPESGLPHIDHELCSLMMARGLRLKDVDKKEVPSYYGSP